MRTYHTDFRAAQVSPSTFIAPGAVVIGDVTLGADSSVWFHAVIRGDTEAISIGGQSNVQDGCVLHADPGLPCRVGNGVTIGHGAIVHGAHVADDVLIGMRAVVMNGARVASGCIIGVGAVVTAGSEIPANSVVLGVPGRVIRGATPEDRQRIKLAAEHYVEAAIVYRQRLVGDG